MYLTLRFSVSLLALCLVGCGGRSAEGLPLETCALGVWFNTPSLNPARCPSSSSIPINQLGDCVTYPIDIFKEGGESSHGVVNFSAGARLVWARVLFAGSWRVEGDSLSFSPSPALVKTFPSAICTEEEIRTKGQTVLIRPSGALVDGILRSIEAGQKTVSY